MFTSAAEGNRRVAQLCPGTNVTFTVEDTEQRLTQNVVFENLHLRDLEDTPMKVQFVTGE